MAFQKLFGGLIDDVKNWLNSNFGPRDIVDVEPDTLLQTLSDQDVITSLETITGVQEDFRAQISAQDDLPLLPFDLPIPETEVITRSDWNLSADYTYVVKARGQEAVFADGVWQRGDFGEQYGSITSNRPLSPEEVYELAEDLFDPDSQTLPFFVEDMQIEVVWGRGDRPGLR